MIAHFLLIVSGILIRYLLRVVCVIIFYIWLVFSNPVKFLDGINADSLFVRHLCVLNINVKFSFNLTFMYDVYAMCFPQLFCGYACFLSLTSLSKNYVTFCVACH